MKLIDKEICNGGSMSMSPCPLTLEELPEEEQSKLKKFMVDVFKKNNMIESEEDIYRLEVDVEFQYIVKKKEN